MKTVEEKIFTRTKSQELLYKVYLFIEGYYIKYKVTPTYAILAKKFKRSTSHIFKIISKLVNLRVLKKIGRLGEYKIINRIKR